VASRAPEIKRRPVIVVPSGEHEPTAFLTDRAAAARVTTAILDVVSKSRNVGT
jgi:hypothetical protein